MIQYFLWYLIFLPFYIPSSSLLQKPRLGLLVAFLWVIAQVRPSPSNPQHFIPQVTHNQD